MKLINKILSFLILLYIFAFPLETQQQQRDFTPSNLGDGKRVLKHGINFGKSFNKDVKKVVRDIRNLQREYISSNSNNGGSNQKVYYVPVKLPSSGSGSESKPIYLGLNVEPTSSTANSPPKEQRFSAYLYVTEIYDSKPVDGPNGKEFNIDLSDKSKLYKVNSENAVSYPNVLPEFNPMQSLNYDATMKGLKDPKQKDTTIVRLALTVVESVRFKNVRDAVHQNMDKKMTNVKFDKFSDNIRSWTKGGDNVKVLHMDNFKFTPNNYNKC
jgi:hypothetical protein